MIRLKAKVEGKVQGVFFRASSKKLCLQLKLVGWVRNNSDGSVELEAEGDKNDLEKLLSWLYSGSPSSRVDSVLFSWEKPILSEKTFEIKKGA